MRAIIISFSGIDGSGKTTISKELVKMLRYAGINAIYRHEYEYMLLRYLLRLINMDRRKRILKNLETYVLRSNESVRLQVPPFVRFWPILVLLDYLLTYIKIKFSRSLEVVVMDRCIYDHWITFKGQGIFSNIMEKLYLLVPAPDISFILVISPEVAYLRKQKTHPFTPDIYKRGLIEYLKIAKLKDLKIVKSSDSVEKTLKEILRILLLSEDIVKLLIKKSSENRTNWWLWEKYSLQYPPKLQIVFKTIFNERVKLLQETLKSLKKDLQKLDVPWVLFKTYYHTLGDLYAPTYDIDILIPQSYKTYVISELKKLGIIYSEDEPNKVNIRMKYPYTVSIHFGACWNGLIYFDYESSRLESSKSQNVYFHGINVPIPPYEYSVLSILAHILFEIKVIRLLDVLEIKTLMKNISNLRNILEISKDHFWEMPTRFIINKMLTISRTLDDLRKPIKLPLMLTIGELLWIYLHIIVAEKRKTHTLNLKRVRVYIYELIRAVIWYFGAKFIKKTPFGDVITPRDAKYLKSKSYFL